MLGQVYGARFREAHGAEPPPVWCAELDKLTNAQLANGYERLMAEAPTHPPSLPEWLRLCRERPRAVPEHRELPPALPEPEESRKARMAKGLEHIANMRELLKG